MSKDLTDPQNATSAAISRRGFTVLGSAALLGASASPGPDDFGKPHPPIVAEDDPAIRVLQPQLDPSAGGAIGAYAAVPKTADARTPGVVVVQHIWGVDAQIRDVVRRLAKSGFVTIAPLLYGRLHAPSGDGVADISVFRPLAENMLKQGFQNTDIAAAQTWTSTQAAQAKTGITGFCMGGAMVLQALQQLHAFTAASIFYGSVEGVDPKSISADVLGNYGERDTSIKPDDVRAFYAKLSPPHDVKIYDEAGHAFFDDTRNRYVASAATDAWRRTLAWFRQYLT